MLARSSPERNMYQPAPHMLDLDQFLLQLGHPLYLARAGGNRRLGFAASTTGVRGLALAMPPLALLLLAEQGSDEWLSEARSTILLRATKGMT